MGLATEPRKRVQELAFLSHVQKDTTNRCLVSTDATDVMDGKSQDVRQHGPSLSLGGVLSSAQWIDGGIWSYSTGTSELNLCPMEILCKHSLESGHCTL